MDSQWLTAPQLAKALQVALPTIRFWTRLGMPCLRAGRLARFRLADVEEWLRSRSAAKTAA